MLLFRSEEHVARWLDERGREAGGSMDLATQWALAQAWYGERLSPAWERPDPARAQAIFDGLGLTGGFWNLSG